MLAAVTSIGISVPPATRRVTGDLRIRVLLFRHMDTLEPDAALALGAFQSLEFAAENLHPGNSTGRLGRCDQWGREAKAATHQPFEST